MSPRPDPADAAVEELLGAYALDACEPEDVAAVEALLERRPDLAAEAAQLTNAAAWIGATEALAAPRSLRAGLDRAVRARGSGTRDIAARCYAAATARVAETIDALDPDDESIRTPNGLTARELVIHLAAQDSAFAEAIGAPPEPGMPTHSIDARTEAFLERYADRPLTDAVELWNRSVAAVLAWADTDASRDAEVSWLGYDLPRSTILVTRSFETWIHRDDLRRVAGRASEVPPASELAEMADFSARNTKLGLALEGRAHAGKTARIVLTGPGGGEWTVAMGEGADLQRAPDVTVTADVVDWCLVAGERLAPDDLERTVEGDRGLAADIVAAVPAFATL